MGYKEMESSGMGDVEAERISRGITSLNPELGFEYIDLRVIGVS